MAQHDRWRYEAMSWPDARERGGDARREPFGYGDDAAGEYRGASSAGRGDPERDFMPHPVSMDPPSRWSGDARTPAVSYAGRGPRGYQRSDARLREDVSDELAQDPFVDASDIDVMVEGGDVTLRGTVATRAEKRRAEDCVMAVRGVRDVSNQLRLQRTASPSSPPEMSSSLLGLGGQPPKDTPERS